MKITRTTIWGDGVITKTVQVSARDAERMLPMAKAYLELLEWKPSATAPKKNARKPRK